MVNLKKNALKRKSTKSNTGKTKKDSKKKEKKKKEVKKKAKKVEDESEEEDSSSDEEGCENNRTVAMNPTNIPQSLRVPEKKILPGASVAPPQNPSWFTRKILEEERPDLIGKNSEFEHTELDLLDKYVKDRAELQVEDYIFNDDNYDEDERQFVRYEIQLKYNEGRYSSIYIVSKQICKDNVMKDAPGLFALKTGVRSGSATFSIKMKRELRILSDMTKAKASWVPHFFDSGNVCDMPFIVMALVDMNIEKLREMIGGKFRPGSAFYIAGEVLNALCELHGHGFVHRDVKPTNICVGVGGQSSRIYLIDFGDTVRTGKKIKYGVPDSYSLPYWSVGNHRRNAATEKNDIEGWFYTLLDLYDSSLLSWKGELNEPDVEKAKTEFWGDYQNNIGQSSQALLSIADLINSSEDSIDEAKLKRYVRAGFEQLVKNPKKFAPEWVRGTVTQTAIAGAKTKRLSVQT